MNLSDFSLGRFLNAKGLSQLGGCGTRASASASALRHPRRPRFVASLHGDALAAQAAFAKIDHSLETSQIHFFKNRNVPYF